MPDEKVYYDPDYPPYEIVRGNFGTKLEDILTEQRKFSGPMTFKTQGS